MWLRSYRQLSHDEQAGFSCAAGIFCFGIRLQSRFTAGDVTSRTLYLKSYSAKVGPDVAPESSDPDALGHALYAACM